MKITFKTTAGRSIVKEFESTNTVADIKVTFKDDYDIVSIRLCYKGKVLDDTKSIGEIGLSDTDAIFLSGKKLSIPKPAAPPVKEPAKSTPEVPDSSLSSLNALISPPTETATTSEDVNQQSTSASVEETVPPTVSDTTIEVSHSLIDTIKGMGFDDEEQIKLALRAAYMNPDRAIDYLISGMSIGKLRELAEEANPSLPVQTGHPIPRGAPNSAVVGMEEVQRALESIPQFDRIREHVVSNPNHLPIAMQQIQQYHPEAFAVIEQNPQAFLSLIGGGVGGEDVGEEGMTDSSDGRVIQLTQEDTAPIERLVSIGGGMWDRHAATLVYLACNKNEEIAANVLFDNGGMPPQLAQAVIDGQSTGGDGEADEEDDN